MPLSPRAVRSQLSILKPLLNNCSLPTLRKWQNKIGELMEFRLRHHTVIKEHSFERFTGAWVIPKDERRQGVILYLHGGGYTWGDLEYATGFGSLLSVQTCMRVFCAGYRLAPEHPFPAALEDSMEAYGYLLKKGYAPENIALCGESAGGGLCYSLCMQLRTAGLPLPGGIIGISPWTDLTASGPSYAENRLQDPSMTLDLLDQYATHYTADRTDPLVSPLLGDLKNMPPSILFVGGDEIMLSDTELLHQKLLAQGCKSQLVVAPERWHAYLLYNLKEDQKDFAAINHFLSQYLCLEYKLRWMRLDNAAKIYPAARRQNWSSLFRLSMTLQEDVDVEVLQSALDVTVRRFPSFAARLRRGVFWYYIQQLKKAPDVQAEYSYPVTKMSRDEIRKCAFRVIAYKNRIALEIFHCLTDGTGGLIFLKSLVAEYLQQKYKASIPAEYGVLGRLEEPSEEEMEDSFQKYAGNLKASRKENNAWNYSAVPDPSGFFHLTCFRLCADTLHQKAKELGVSVNTYLAACLMMALQNLQAEVEPNIKKRGSIKVLLPVNLRQLFPSKTLRNFAMYFTPEIQPKLGYYDFKEICHVIEHSKGAEVTPKRMSMRIATNVGSEKMLLVKLMPLFVKNAVMKAVFDAVGERKACLTMSNLGKVKLPEPMMDYVQRLDFILGVQATKPNNCGVITFGDTVYVNFIRNIREPALERHYHQVLQSLGISAIVESNHQEE